MADVFISYAHADRDLARTIAGHLTDAGADVWWDRELIAGDDFDQAILEWATIATCMVVIWTPNSISSRYVRDEARIAAEPGRLIPVRLSGVEPPLGFRTFHLIEFGPSGIDTEFIRRLVHAVGERIGRTLQDPGSATAGRQSHVHVPWILSVAVDFAQSITEKFDKARALADIATVMAASDPGRAAGLTTDAERIAQTLAEESERARALAHVATAMAASDPGRAARLSTDAERIAQAISVPWSKVLALADVAKAMAASDPGRAERIARMIDDHAFQAMALAEVAKAMAASDPSRAAPLMTDAERIAQMIPGPLYKVKVVADVAAVAAPSDPSRASRLMTEAERMARATTFEPYRAWALAFVAKATAATDPDRAARLAADAEGMAQAITNNPRLKAEVLADVVKATAVTNPDRAERIAQAITITSHKVTALVAIAAAIR